MQVRYIKQRDAKEFISKHHRTHQPSVGSIFCVGLFDGDNLVGVAMAGRPVAYEYDSKMPEGHKVIEVTRCCVLPGVRNGCSLLYSRCIQLAKLFGGFDSVISYTLIDEPGASLRASGFVSEGISGNPDWTGSRKRGEKNGLKKVRWRYSISSSENEKPKKDSKTLTRTQKSALTWLDVVRHSFSEKCDALFFAADPDHDALQALFPWKEYGIEGVINERLVHAGLEEIDFRTDLGVIEKLLPDKDDLFSEENGSANAFKSKYDMFVTECDKIIQDMTDYLLITDLMYNTDFKAAVS